MDASWETLAEGTRQCRRVWPHFACSRCLWQFGLAFQRLGWFHLMIHKDPPIETTRLQGTYTNCAVALGRFLRGNTRRPGDGG